MFNIFQRLFYLLSSITFCGNLKKIVGSGNLEASQLFFCLFVCFCVCVFKTLYYIKNHINFKLITVGDGLHPKTLLKQNHTSYTCQYKAGQGSKITLDSDRMVKVNLNVSMNLLLTKVFFDPVIYFVLFITLHHMQLLEYETSFQSNAHPLSLTGKM